MKPQVAVVDGAMIEVTFDPKDEDVAKMAVAMSVLQVTSTEVSGACTVFSPFATAVMIEALEEYIAKRSRK